MRCGVCGDKMRPAAGPIEGWSRCVPCDFWSFSSDEIEVPPLPTEEEMASLPILDMDAFRASLTDGQRIVEGK
jgi:hypothetical protein